jgi:hypothetical protein
VNQKIKWVPEPFNVSGSMEAEGFIDLLGEPSVTRAELLVRETAQNSWDARIATKNSTVEMDFSGFNVEAGTNQYKTLTENVFGSRPDKKHFPALQSSLSKQVIPILVIRDSNTAGLGGVTNSSSAVPKNAKSRYRKFLLNIGERKHPEFGGGSYGYGRSICFRVSKCRTAIVYTRTKDDLSSYESRLIAVAYGPAFEKDRKNYTGKHWWSTYDKAGQPIVGKNADDIASKLGIKQYGATETGTTIVILDPEIGINIEDAMSAVSQAILINLWPKYVQIRDRVQPMSFRVSCNGRKIDVPDPRAMSSNLIHFVSAYENVLNMLEKSTTKRSNTESLIPGVLKCGDILQHVNSAKPPIGKLCVASLPRARVPLIESEETATSELKIKLHSLTNHVALMRTPDLVVTYLEVAMHPDAQLGVFGVFKSSEAANEIFLKCEPPAHDDWSNKISDETGKRYANAVTRQIGIFLKAEIVSSLVEGFGSSDGSATAIGERLGNSILGSLGRGSIGGVKGEGPGGSSGGSNGGRKTGTRRVQISAPDLSPSKDQRIIATWNLTFEPYKIENTYDLEIELVTGDGHTFESLKSPINGYPRFFEFRGILAKASSKTSEVGAIITVPDAGGAVSISVEYEKGTMPTLSIRATEFDSK